MAGVPALRTPRRILVLAGSTEASALVRRLVGRPEVEVVSSFAGRVRRLALPPGSVRVGGFGGPDGLVRYLADHRVAAVIDATHPFTARMPAHARQACATLGIPRLRVLRPEWRPEPGDVWHQVEDLPAAAAALVDLGVGRVFLTTGRQELAPFAGVPAWYLVRAIEPPDLLPLERAVVVLARGPFALEEELALMAEHRVEVLVTKNSGGTAAAAKLEAARTLGLPVVMVRRPPTVGPAVGTPAGALAWLERTLGLPPQLPPGPPAASS